MPIPQRRRRIPRRKPKMRRGIRPQNKARMVNVKQQVHFFKRNFVSTPVTGGPGLAPLLSSTFFSLNNIPGVNDFVNLFQRYMITYVKLNFYLTVDPSAQAAASAVYPKLYLVRDYTDTATPASLNALREHGKVKIRVLNPNKPVTIGLRPASLNLVNKLGGTQSYTPVWKQWHEMGNLPTPLTDVPFFGLKWGIDNFTNTNYSLNVEGVMYFRCKDLV